MQRECENLSGGEMQMVAISRALLGAPGPGAVRRAEPGPGAEGRAGRDEDRSRGCKREGVARAGGRAERAERARRRRPRLRDATAAASSTRAGAGALRDDARAARRAAGGLTTMAAPLLHVDRPRQALPRGLLRPQVTFSLEADFAIDGPVGRRRDGAERLGQDHAVRADHRQQPADARAACWSTARTSTTCATRERDRLAIHYHQSYQVRSLPAHAARLPAGARAQRRRRWCTCSTSRSSTPRTATSASCSTSSAGCAREGRLVFLCLHPNEPLPPRHPARGLRALRLRRARPARPTAPRSPSWQQRRAGARLPRPARRARSPAVSCSYSGSSVK